MSRNEIPKKIHYCWFGRNPLPKTALKCIQSWKKYFPDYEIIQWNEDNYDVNKIKYIREAHQAKKYAFVSDYARFDILYHEGGIYFDTDVEVIKSFDDILQNGAFMGCEIDGINLINADPVDDTINLDRHANKARRIIVSPGLGMATAPGLSIYREILEFYSTQTFLNADGGINQETVGVKTTKILCDYGMQNSKGIQKVGDITIYPKEYFNPLNNNTGVIEKTVNTHSIHWYTMSWISPAMRIKSRITRIFHRIFGEECFSAIKRK